MVNVFPPAGVAAAAPSAGLSLLLHAAIPTNARTAIVERRLTVRARVTAFAEFEGTGVGVEGEGVVVRIEYNQLNVVGVEGEGGGRIESSVVNVTSKRLRITAPEMS